MVNRVIEVIGESAIGNRDQQSGICYRRPQSHSRLPMSLSLPIADVPAIADYPMSLPLPITRLQIADYVGWYGPPVSPHPQCGIGVVPPPASLDCELITARREPHSM